MYSVLFLNTFLIKENTSSQGTGFQKKIKNGGLSKERKKEKNFVASNSIQLEVYANTENCQKKLSTTNESVRFNKRTYTICVFIQALSPTQVLSWVVLLCDTYFMAIAKTLHQHKQKFLLYLSLEKGRSEKTIENYDRYIKKFLFFTKATYIKDITEDSVREYQDWLRNQMFCSGRDATACEPIKGTTQNYHLSALRSFLKYLRLQYETELAPSEIALSHVSRTTPHTLSDMELNKLLSTPQGNDVKTLRDRAILFFLFATGVRVSELCALNTDIDLTNDEIPVYGKGEKMRMVYLSPEAKEAVHAYLEARDDTSEALFVNNGKRVSLEGDTRLSSRSVQRIVRQYGLEAGIAKKITPHTLRHTCRSDLQSKGADTVSLKMLLGVENIAKP